MGVNRFMADRQIRVAPQVAGYLLRAIIHPKQSSHPTPVRGAESSAFTTAPASPPCHLVGMRRSIVAVGRIGVTSDLPGDRRRTPAKPPPDLTHAEAIRSQC